MIPIPTGSGTEGFGLHKTHKEERYNACSRVRYVSKCQYIGDLAQGAIDVIGIMKHRKPSGVRSSCKEIPKLKP